MRGIGKILPMTLEEARIQPVYAKNDDLLTVSR